MTAPDDTTDNTSRQRGHVPGERSGSTGSEAGDDLEQAAALGATP